MRIIGIKPKCPLCKQLKRDFMRINSKLPIEKRFIITSLPFDDPQTNYAFKNKMGNFSAPFILIDNMIIKGYRRDLTYLILKVLELNGDLLYNANLNYKG